MTKEELAVRIIEDNCEAFDTRAHVACCGCGELINQVEDHEMGCLMMEYYEEYWEGGD